MEVLAVRWLFPGKEVRIDTVCLDCGEPIVVRMLDEEIRGRVLVRLIEAA
jgi:hypothetical protein